VTETRLRWLGSGRALTALGLLAVLAALVGAHVLQQEVQNRAIRGATASARIIVSLVVARNIRHQDIAGHNTPSDETSDMNDDIDELRRNGQIADLDVWSLADGGAVYIDLAARDGENGSSRLSASQLRRARLDTFVATRSETLAVFLPYDPAGGDDYTAVVEVQLPSDPIDESVRLWTSLTYAGAGLAVILTFAVMFFSSRRRRREEHAARHDALTGLGNRLQLAELTGKALADAVPGRSTALLLLDLDGFNDVNDTLGHEAGDQLLAVVADRLRGVGADADALVRLGGDEFVVLLAGLRGPQDAVLAAEAIRLALRRPIMVADLPVEIDASVGVALAPEHGDDMTTLLKRADVAMYEAKRAGAGVVVYDLTTDSREAQHLSVLAELREGIEAGQLRLFYQPKCHPDGRIEELEALVRWQHPTRGLLPPSEFVELAERTSLIRPLTAWVLREAARQCGEWKAQGRELTVAVNISARNLLDDDLIDTLTSATEAAGIPLQTLRLEITETAVLTDPERVTVTLARLAALGLHVSIDDFGVGYTSLSYLASLPINALKIDRRFVTDLLTRPVDEILVRNVINLARDLGLDTVAEGVETAEVWQRLAELGCDEIQGYLLTRPLPPAEIEPWLDQWRPQIAPAYGSSGQEAVVDARTH
jgi:diguanylate cyclase (GGDEF)-like protein